ncbi:MAG TPA: DegT/DnrJ/EryC1/StrS aminotransferase family protein [Thermoanaerobaculia bacterium]|nr:DegT/DnrJ/EryC1/StrS aminotransferase family protein [Thermoanaerobaculia bacterium]
MTMNVPFFRPDIRDGEIEEVVSALRSGWLTTGPRTKRFEAEFASAVGGKHAVAVNSCTAALHLALEALGLQRGQGVLVPTMTFAATAEVVRYFDAVPLLVDCDPVTGNMDLEHAARVVAEVRAGRALKPTHGDVPVVGVMPVTIGGYMLDVDAVEEFARRFHLWVVEDAAHAFPAAWRRSSRDPWRRCGEGTASVSCFSFYANKTITTGEGGMAVTDDAGLAERMRLMSLHGLSHDAWDRYSGGRAWDYRILAPGYKYNMTDTAAGLGLAQLARAEEMRRAREGIARRYRAELASASELELPADDDRHFHSWHLFPIRLRLERLGIDRNRFVDELKSQGVGCSVHFRPLHLHPYYQETFGWRAEDLPAATALFARLVSLPLFPTMRDEEVRHVVRVVKEICGHFVLAEPRRVAALAER